MHIPVLKNEVIEAFEYLKARKSGVFVDGTLGAGGHSLAIARNFQFSIYPKGPLWGNFQFIGIDKDETALEIAKKNAEKNNLIENFTFVHDDFKNVREILATLEIEKIDGALLDLGISSMQIDDEMRGFSFKNPEAKLDMRMDQDQSLTARYVVNEYRESDLAKIIFDFGEEKFGREIAREIIHFRYKNKIETVGDLLEVIGRAIPHKSQHIYHKHFATRTFQAIRIEVNKELSGLDQAIESFVDMLEKESKLAIITFHSLEDRIVKNTFRRLADPCQCPKSMPCICGKEPIARIITKKPIIPTEDETEMNHRSRSAKLRIVEKI